MGHIPSPLASSPLLAPRGWVWTGPCPWAAPTPSGHLCSCIRKDLSSQSQMRVTPGALSPFCLEGPFFLSAGKLLLPDLALPRGSSEISWRWDFPPLSLFEATFVPAWHHLPAYLPSSMSVSLPPSAPSRPEVFLLHLQTR